MLVVITSQEKYLTSKRIFKHGVLQISEPISFSTNISHFNVKYQHELNTL